MKKAILIAALGLSLPSAAAIAAERTTDAALGAVSGAVVLGPIGAVAGALVGYTAGPSIAHSWGMRRSGSAHKTRRSAGMGSHAAANDKEPAHSVQAAAPVHSGSTE